MAAYREHISVSSLLGVGVGVGAYLALGFTPIQGALAGWFTALGGMMPDLDSETGRPVREMFALVAAIAPLALVGRLIGLLGIESTPELVMLLIVAMYLIIRYGGSAIIGAVSVHRGMFHSLPAMIIAAEITYLAYPHESPKVKFLMGAGVAIGFFSHLFLDEMYSVQWSGVRIKLKKSAGSAIKMFGKLFVPNVVTYSILAVLSYMTAVDIGLIQPKDPEPIWQQADAVDLGHPEDPTRVAELPAEMSPFDTPSLNDTSLGVPQPVDPNPFAIDATTTTPPNRPTPTSDGFRMPLETRPGTSPPSRDRTGSGLILPRVNPNAFDQRVQ